MNGAIKLTAILLLILLAIIGIYIEETTPINYSTLTGYVIDIDFEGEGGHYIDTYVQMHNITICLEGKCMLMVNTTYRFTFGYTCFGRMLLTKVEVVN
jgi:hypothetical protein